MLQIINSHNKNSSIPKTLCVWCLLVTSCRCSPSLPTLVTTVGPIDSRRGLSGGNTRGWEHPLISKWPFDPFWTTTLVTTAIGKTFRFIEVNKIKGYVGCGLFLKSTSLNRGYNVHLLSTYLWSRLPSKICTTWPSAESPKRDMFELFPEFYFEWVDMK